MPDTYTTANAVRALPARLPVHRSPATGLPLVDTLSLQQREQLRHAQRVLQLAADQIEEALDANRAGHALEALATADAAGQVCAGIAAGLGR